AVTGLEVALISAIATAAAVMVAPITAVITMRLTHRHERRLNVYNDRRDSYLALLQYNERNAVWLDALVEAFQQNSNAKLQEPIEVDPDTYAATVARVGAFAPDEL